LLVGKIFDCDQQLDRPLFLGKCRERAQEITIFKGGVLPAFNAGQLFLDDLRQRVMLTPPLRRARSLRKRLYRMVKTQPRRSPSIRRRHQLDSAFEHILGKVLGLFAVVETCSACAHSTHLLTYIRHPLGTGKNR